MEAIDDVTFCLSSLSMPGYMSYWISQFVISNLMSQFVMSGLG